MRAPGGNRDARPEMEPRDGVSKLLETHNPASDLLLCLGRDPITCLLAQHAIISLFLFLLDPRAVHYLNLYQSNTHAIYRDL